MAEDSQAELKSVDDRDREWLATIYRGDKERDLTVRAVLAGMIFGGLMSLSNLYVGLKSGWGLGVDIAAVVVIFAVFKTLRGMCTAFGIPMREFGLQENTMTMTVSVAASWISSAGLVSAVPALMMLVPSFHIVWWQLALFIAAILYLGLFMAIPLKRQMIQVDSLRFPANIPTGETLIVMYSHGGDAMKKAVALGIAGLAGALLAVLRDGLGWIPGLLPLPWRLRGIALSKLTLSFEPSLIFIGIGAICGIKVGLSMLLGLVLNYGILAPYLINEKIIVHDPPKIEAAAAPQLPLAVAAGQTLTVQLEEAVAQPELPTPEQLNANPELASTVRSSVFRYTWTRPAVYCTLSALIHDLNAPELLNGRSANPIHDAVEFYSKHDANLDSDVLCCEAPLARKWEAKLSFPQDQPQILVPPELHEEQTYTDALDVVFASEGTAIFSAITVGGSTAIGLEPGQNKLATVGGFRNISFWSLWPGATILVVGGLLSLAFQWRSLGRTFASIFTSFSKSNAGKGPLDHIEIPMSWFVVGFLVIGIVASVLLTWFFSIHWWMGAVAVVLTFFLAAVTARAGAEIGLNPIGPMGKVTQLTYGAIAPGNITANLMTAGVTAGAACSCSDTVGNLKVGHMVGANPRKQFISQLFGVMAGALLAVPAYFILVPDVNALGGEKFPAPSALVWKGVAEVLSKGFESLPAGALAAVIVAFAAGVIIVVVDRFFPKLKPYTPSPAALGMSMTMPAYTIFAMFLGSLIGWILEKRAAKVNDMYTIPVASGCIAGESIMAVIFAALVAFGVMH
jgi:uncharacterized oligopeptide transporter (OPT) family protein